MIEIQQLSWNHRSTDGYINTTSLKHPSSFHVHNLPMDQHLFNKFTTSGISNEAITFNIMSHRDIPSMWSTNLEAAPKARFSCITTNPLHHQGTQVMAVVSNLRESNHRIMLQWPQGLKPEVSCTATELLLIFCIAESMSLFLCIRIRHRVKTLIQYLIGDTTNLNIKNSSWEKYDLLWYLTKSRFWICLLKRCSDIPTSMWAAPICDRTFANILAGATYCIQILYHLKTCDKHFKKMAAGGVLKRVHPIKLLLMKGGLSKNKDVSHQDSSQNSVKHLEEES